ncbi:acyltransferase family protein [Streptomyces sp. HNM0574]|uniref:acyltransferase family protein n=1 Tax=Streptomyces sp. HNM0574 TaxID=2714954 RepID=UPI00146AA713|nr:acyltransferase family protein [Streptomyces sp. HNM0574]NLU68347.1 acyltransferase family protein [Streptomyces sp. HNM0574]
MSSAGSERAPLPLSREKSVPPVAHAAARGEQKSGGRRDPFLDNAKYLTIVLVAIGHAWSPLVDDSRTASALYMVVYTFHMPAFIMISGYLSRSFEGTPRQVRRLLTGVVAPYLVFQTVYTFFMRAVDNPEREFRYQEPGFALWFLVALFLWRITTPLWKNLRWPVPVSLAVAVAASVTPSIDNDLNLMRVAQFLPFFVLGLQLRPEHFRLVRTRTARLAAVPVAGCAVVLAYWAVPRMSSSWFLHDRAAQAMGVPAWVGAVMYLALFGCALVLTACFLAWVPGRRLWCTALGAGTLYAYLLHVYPIKLARVLGWYDMQWVDHPLSRVAITVLAAVMMTVLCTAPVRKAFRFLVEPRMDWLFARQTPARHRRPRPGAAPPPGEDGSPPPAGKPRENATTASR